MAKKASSTGETADTPKTGNLSEPKSASISIEKFFQLHAPEIHSYTRAYLGEQFRGIMKSKEEWTEELKKIMEGDK